MAAAVGAAAGLGVLTVMTMGRTRTWEEITDTLHSRARQRYRSIGYYDRALEPADLAQGALVSVARTSSQPPSIALASLALDRRAIDHFRSVSGRSHRPKPRSQRPPTSPRTPVPFPKLETDNRDLVWEPIARDEYTGREELADVRAALQRLSPRDQAAIAALAYGIEREALARRWGVSASRVSQVISRAVQRLAQILESGDPRTMEEDR